MRVFIPVTFAVECSPTTGDRAEIEAAAADSILRTMNLFKVNDIIRDLMADQYGCEAVVASVGEPQK